MDVIALVKSWEGLAWLYSAAYTLNKLSTDPSIITIRAGGRGFDIRLPVIFSGNGTIIDCETQFDTSLTAILG